MNGALEALSVKALIDLRAAETPSWPFLLDPGTGRQIPYGEMQDAVRAFAGHMRKRGILPGESVAFALENGLSAARVILGSFYGGFVATAVNLVSGANTIAYVAEHSEARVVFVDAKTRPIVAEALAGLERGPALVDIDESWFTGITEPGEDIAPSQDGLLMYTSGTTGVPKGVVLTHANLVAGGANPAMAHELTSQDRALCVLPLYHINGLCVTLMGPLVSGGSVVLPVRFSVSSFWGHLRNNSCTWFSVVPTQISYLLHNAEKHRTDGLEQLRFGRSASAPLSPDVQEGFETRFGVPIIETMGLTETAAQILSNPLPPGLRKIGSPGVAVGNEIRIGDQQQNELPRGSEGEVLVRGANVMRIYRNNPEATEASLTPEGWLRTGDLGRMDAEGYVFITGRLKELIIKGGENIAPREIDDILYSHGAVIEAAAFARPCSQYGQRVEAAVKVQEGAGVTEAELLALCTAKTGSFKAPDRVHFLSELPKGPSGKIQRLKLAELTVVASDA